MKGVDVSGLAASAGHATDNFIQGAGKFILLLLAGGFAVVVLVAIVVGIFFAIKHWPRGHGGGGHGGGGHGGHHGHWYDPILSILTGTFKLVWNTVWALAGLAAGCLILFWLVQWGIEAAHSVYPMPKVNGLRPAAVGRVVTDTPKGAPTPADTRPVCESIPADDRSVHYCTGGPEGTRDSELNLHKDEFFCLKGDPLSHGIRVFITDEAGQEGELGKSLIEHGVTWRFTAPRPHTKVGYRISTDATCKT